MAETHYFDIEVARRYGVNCAVLLQNLWHWVRKNEANNKHFHDGFYWTYNSTKAFQELFPYLSQRQIETALKRLRDEDVIKTGNYNAVAYDRTLWYAITEKGKSILHTSEMDIANKGNGNDTEGKPIPNINTDNKLTNINTDIKKKERKASYDEILSNIEDADLKTLYLDYIKMRKLIKSPMTDRALQMLIKKVNELEPDSIDRQKQMLENAIMNNWKSVYPIKKEANNGQSNNASNKRCGDEYAFLE
jgi:DNA-binding PadR family transcriptional regulator